MRNFVEIFFNSHQIFYNMLRIISLLALFVTLSSFDIIVRDGSTERIHLQHRHKEGNHIEYYPPADMPEVYFDSDEMEIIIEADGFADYYVVNIISQITMQSVIYTQISGYGDTVDVSSLPDGYYHLVITSSNNNVFDGYFMIETE